MLVSMNPLEKGIVFDILTHLLLFIKKYRALATNGNVQDKFSNYALAETQKSIFKTDNLISNNILADLNNSYIKQKENLMKTAFMDKKFDMATLKIDLEKLAIDTYSSQVSPPELDKLLATIPREIDMMVGLENVSQSPSKTFKLLKNVNYLPNITIEQRKDLQEKAKAILKRIFSAIRARVNCYFRLNCKAKQVFSSRSIA